MSSSLPTRENAAVVFLDLQDEIVKNSRTVSLDQLRARAVALAQLAALHGLPVFASSVPPGGAYLAEIIAASPGLQPRPRTQTSAFSDAGLVEALRASGRSVLLLSGVASEIVVQRTALDAVGAGFAAHVAVDACGGISERTEEAAWRRIVQAGGVTTSAITFSAELAGDFTTEAGGKSLGIMYEMLGA